MTAQQDGTATMLRNGEPEFILGVTGSRDWWNRTSVWIPLNVVRAKYPRLLVRNGKCPRGLDRIVTGWTKRYEGHGVEEDPHPADWDAHGPTAGNRRNKEMVDAGMHLLLAWVNPCRKNSRWCPKGVHPSHGSANCVDLARAAGIPVRFSPHGMSW